MTRFIRLYTPPNAVGTPDPKEIERFREVFRDQHRRQAETRTHKLTLSLSERNMLWDALQRIAEEPGTTGELRAMCYYVIKKVGGHPVTTSTAYVADEKPA